MLCGSSPKVEPIQAGSAPTPEKPTSPANPDHLCTIHPALSVDLQLKLTDNLMIMYVKQMQYVQTLTGYKFGFILNGKKQSQFAEKVTADLMPAEYWPVWEQINKGESSRCRNLRNFLNKMLASKSKWVLKEFFAVYMLALQKMLYIEGKFKPAEYTERQLIEFSKLFSRNFLKRIIIQNEYHEFLEIDQRFAGMALLHRAVQIREIKDFQERFLSLYTRWRTEFGHLLEVIYFCLAVEYYNLPVSYLYEGYFKNTELETQRNIPTRVPNKITEM